MNKKREKMMLDYIDVIKKYLADDNIHDISLVKHDIEGFTPNEKEALFIAKNYLDNKTYKHLLGKICSISTIMNVDARKELIKKVEKLAKAIENREANLIDVKSETHMDMTKYIYAVKQLYLFYHRVSKKTLLANNEYYNRIKGYKDFEVKDLNFMGVSPGEDKIIRTIIERNHLKLNQYTYMAAYDYTLRKRFIDVRRK